MSDPVYRRLLSRCMEVSPAGTLHLCLFELAERRVLQAMRC